MDQLGAFILNHWVLWSLLLVILLAIIVNESLLQKTGANELTPEAAVNQINHLDAVICDIRDKDSFKKGHIINALQAKAEDFEQGKMNQYKEKPLILVCNKGDKTLGLAQKLKAQGFAQAQSLKGGMEGWLQAGMPTVKNKK